MGSHVKKTEGSFRDTPSSRPSPSGMEREKRAGKIMLVGFGPGAAGHMTYRARAAIEEADVVIGYSTYIKLVRDLLDGKEVVRKGMTEEVDRCVEAYARARQGKKVALISSGDAGVYGMAGPTYEVLFQQGWTPDSAIEVEVVPGTTALNACASLVGAPLTHDFCSISLSDLLTPWPVIRKRINAAGAADFVLALYNPKSGRRTGQIAEAQKILLRHRRPDTPVAIVKSAYRRRQDVRMTTLNRMAECDIGMLTTVLVGNSASFVRDGLMITPRGYANKYDRLSGEALDGEQAGRSLSMGLDGWQACVRRYLRDGENSAFEKAAAYFDVPLGEILAAVAGAAGDDAAGEYRAGFVPQQRLARLLKALPGWGRLRAVIRAPAGALTECLLHGDQFALKGEWLSCVTDAFHVHVHWTKVASTCFTACGDKSPGVYFLDEAADPVFRLLLVRDGGTFNAAALQAFETAWHDLEKADETGRGDTEGAEK